jgi:alpha-galactosidase
MMREAKWSQGMEQSSRVVTIGEGELHLALRLPAHGMPEILVLTQGKPSVGVTAERAPRVNGMDVPPPTAVMLPLGGMGFFGWPAIAGHRAGQDFILEFSDWQVEGEGKSTTLSAQDKIAGIEISLTLTVSQSVVSSAVKLTNLGKQDYSLDRCMAGSMIFEGPHPQLTTFTGSWGREFHRGVQSMGKGLWLQESRRGRTSHDKSPGLLLEDGGQTLAAHLGWSGNHVLAIDELDDGRRLVHLGELFEPGEIQLKQGESYESPTAYFARTPDDLRAKVRAMIAWPGGSMRPRPVTLNTWEGIYFDHDLDQLKAQASAASVIGIERFVLDDGWFGLRDDDASSLGDWFVDKRKYPNGLAPLVRHVTGLGMEFGIWFEPEMISPASELYRNHPEWALQVKGRLLLLSRNQLVLDLTREDVCDYLFNCMHAVLKNHAISYIKWDMNRDLTHVGDAMGRAATARQTRAFYALVDRVRAAHPEVEIESCASGGGRADYRVLQRTHRIWTSDCTDAYERLEIQRGARTFFPPEILGSHVSASPNHQTHRRHTLAFRSIVALAYHFGVELDPLVMSEDERGELGAWIALHKKLRPVLHSSEGQFHLDPIDGRYVWGAIADKKIVVIVAQGAHTMSEQPRPLQLSLPIAPSSKWRISAQHPHEPEYIKVSESQRRLLGGAARFSGADMVSSGLPIPMLRPESAVVFEIECVEGT